MSVRQLKGSSLYPCSFSLSAASASESPGMLLMSISAAFYQWQEHREDAALACAALDLNPSAMDFSNPLAD